MENSDKIFTPLSFKDIEIIDHNNKNKSHIVGAHENFSFTLKNCPLFFLGEVHDERVSISITNKNKLISKIINSFLAAYFCSKIKNCDLNMEPLPLDEFISIMNMNDIFITTNSIFNISELNGLFGKLEYMLLSLGEKEFLRLSDIEYEAFLAAKELGYSHDIFETLEKEVSIPDILYFNLLLSPNMSYSFFISGYSIAFYGLAKNTEFSDKRLKSVFENIFEKIFNKKVSN